VLLTLGPVLGADLGALLMLGCELGTPFALYPVLGPARGADLGALLMLGCELGTPFALYMVLGDKGRCAVVADPWW
jgi:hypothetical protein